MEYVEGQPLKGPLPLAEALRYAAQIAEALDHAHRRGITHRDLKPANILLTKSGVKLLDFGLAKVAQASACDSDATQTMGLTQAGAVMGTPQYMAPEQVEGKEADARTDIFAFGAVLYELITGKKAFEGKSAASVMAAVMREEPAASPEISGPLEPVLRRCLAKDAERRWHCAADLKLELERVQEEKPAAASPAKPLAWMAATAALAVLAAALGYAWLRQPPVAGTRPFRLSVAPPEKAKFTGDIVVSPDGRLLAFTAGAEGSTALWVRPLDSLAARLLPGTEGASDPFWSPDSRSLGFFADGKLKRVEVAGGAPQTLCGASRAQGGAWSSDGVIVFGKSAAAMQRVSASGGAPILLTEANPESSPRWPQFLPGGRRFLYSTGRAIYAASLDKPREPVRVLEAAGRAEYAPPEGGRPGYLLWMRQGTLLAQRFDADRLSLEGEPVPLAEAVDAGVRGAARFSTGHDVLVYASGIASGYQMTWVDRTGRSLGTTGPAGDYSYVRLSPDGRRAALMRTVEGNLDVWLHEFARDITTRLTFNPGNDGSPVWSPDGTQVAFSASRSGVTLSLFRKNAAGAGEEQRLTQASYNQYLDDWSPDGRYLLYMERQPETNTTNTDLWVLPLEGDNKPIPVVRTSFNESGGQFSPDGKWIAYTSDESGRSEVYVQAFPPTGGKWQISTNGGVNPKWRRDGRELFFVSGQALMVAAVRASGNGVEADTPRELFRMRRQGYDVTADGQRFLVLAPGEQAEQKPLTVIYNWQAGLPR